MELIIVTPEGLAFHSENVERVNIPTTTGEIGVMEDHEPLISNIEAGEIEIVVENDTVMLAVSRGILQVEPNNRIRILADTAELDKEIDLDRAASARREAEEFLAKTDVTDFAQVEYLQGIIQKELARESVGKKYKNVG